MIFLGVRTVAVAVLEVDAEILDRLARQLLADAGVDRRQRRMVADAERRAERRGVGRVVVHRLLRDAPDLGRGVEGEQLSAAVDRVHRLPARSLARVGGGKREVRFGEGLARLIEERAVQRQLSPRRSSLSSRHPL